MPSRLTLVLLVYAVLIGVFGAALMWIAIVGGLAVLWQLCATIAAGATPPEPPRLEDEFDHLTPEDIRRMADDDDDEI